MTTNHIDQLTEWWENAEVPTRATLPKDGDRIIIRYNSEWYEVATADGDAGEHELSADTRILARAPKPKPAWHDADFIVARYENDDYWQGYLRSDSLWIDSEGQKYTTGVLRDVTPLIEAKVTDEMVECAAMIQYAQSRAPEPATRAQMWEWATESARMDYRALARQILTAALGLDVEPTPPINPYAQEDA